MKKYLLSILTAALLLAPLQGILVQAQGPVPAQENASPVQEQNPSGTSPAQTDAVASMTPAIHAVILAMLHQDAASFDGAEPVLGWEALYNMLSLYGQLDDRSEYLGEDLVLPVETVMDFAVALVPSYASLGSLPSELADRMVYDPEIDSYLVTCGSDSLSQIQVENVERTGQVLHLSGALVYLVDGSALARFQAVFTPQDNMFGYTISHLEIA